MYEKSLELEPEGIRTLCNFGLFCYKKLKKMDDAEDMERGSHRMPRVSEAAICR